MLFLSFDFKLILSIWIDSMRHDTKSLSTCIQ
jgi:hypothetical protein